MGNVSWVLKSTVSTKLLFLCIQTHIFVRLGPSVLFLCIQTHIFVRLGPSVRLEENNNFLIQYYLLPNSFQLKLLKACCEMSETRVHFDLKRVEYLNGSLFVENQLRKGIGFEILGPHMHPKLNVG